MEEAVYFLFCMFSSVIELNLRQFLRARFTQNVSLLDASRTVMVLCMLNRSRIRQETGAC